MAVLRAGMVLVAAVACAWFALGVRQAHDTHAATALVDGAKLSASQARKADSLLKSAAALNPDREIDLLRAQVALRRAQPQRALRLAQQVARREPQNIEAWVVVAQAGYDGNDRPVLLGAARQLVRLDPLGRE